VWFQNTHHLPNYRLLLCGQPTGSIHQIYEAEAVGTNTSLMSMDSAFLQSYQQSSITQASEGPYIAWFPWKENKPHLPSNITICKKRTQTLVNKLRKLLKFYKSTTKSLRSRKNVGSLNRCMMVPQLMFITCPTIRL